MNDLPFIAESQKLCQHLNELKLDRVLQKKKIGRKYNLTEPDKIQKFPALQFNSNFAFYLLYNNIK